MELHVLFGQRRGRYPGEYGLEALAVASECDFDENPDYMPEQLAECRKGDEFEALQIVKMQVSEAAVRAILFPQNKVLQAAVVGGEGEP